MNKVVFLVPLPQRVRNCLSHNTHLGLLLDKYVESWDPGAPAGKLSELVQKPTVEKVARLSQQPPEGFDYSRFKHRRDRLLESLGAVEFACTTVGPLTLHLARASALENAGICLHPLYGFVYLPATGLKGMARAYAETVWLPAQSDLVAAWRQIETIFGWAPNSDDRKHWKPEAVPRHAPEDAARAGAIVFHDAWPKQWPRLVHDLINNHHRDYYGAAAGDNRHPPGDWETPNMVSFLAVVPGTTFSFAVSKRPSSVPTDALLSLAREWLTGALGHEGAGAKTAAGYGYFKPDKTPVPSLPASGRLLREYTLELVTPAFLAGADQGMREDCQLRPATLRGLLRWWWRTLHAGFVEIGQLRRLEAAVWGDTHAAGAVRLDLEPLALGVPLPFDKTLLIQKNGLPRPAATSTQGLAYHSYGMDEKKGRRWFLAPPVSWRLRFRVRQAYFPTEADPRQAVRVNPPLVLEQAQLALWLLCHFGGVGSKGRKGFGSFADPENLQDCSLDKCKQAAAAFRAACRLAAADFDVRRAESPALAQLLKFADLPLPWTNSWFVLDQVGAAAQSFAQGYAHKAEKAALGLPRQIHGPRREPMGHQRGRHQPPQRLSGPHGDRQAAPVHYHLARGSQDALVLRVAAFPMAGPADLAVSQRLLQELLDHLQVDLARRGIEYRDQGKTRPINSAAPPGVSATTHPMPAAPGLPRPGSLVDGVLVPDPKAKDRRYARHQPSGLIGPIVNGAEVPAEKQLGQTVQLIVASLSSDGKQIQFRYPTAADEGKRKPSLGGKPGGGPSRGPTSRGGKR